MTPFIRYAGAAAPLPIDNLDTDQLMPKQFLRGIDKSGLAAGLLYNLRFAAGGTPRESCVFNKPGFEQTGIIAGGPNFGCGSSREHAVWGLLQFGIRAVIAPSFGEIFYSNCFNNGLLAARVTAADSQEILSALSDTAPVTLEIDLPEQKIALSDQSAIWHFDIAPRHKMMLLEGLDMIEATLRDAAEIAAFRERHEAAFPWMARLPGKCMRARCGA